MDGVGKETISQWKDVINNHIYSYTYEHIDHQELATIIKDVMSDKSSKRVRATLCCLCCDMFSSPNGHAFDVALAIEFFHNFTLVHDDIMDEAPCRRSTPTVYKAYGRDIAILVGDMIHIEAYRVLNQLPASMGQEVTSHLNQTAQEVCIGQYDDLNQEASDEMLSTEDYMNMVRLKTAVLLALSMSLGAYVGGGTDKQQRLLYDAGISLGKVFQIRDDYLDVYGGTAQTGKIFGGDILARKKTLPFILAYQNATPHMRQTLNHLLLHSQKEDRVEQIICIYDSLNVKEHIKILEKKYYERANEMLEQLNIPREKKMSFHNYASYLLSRIS